MKITLEDLRAKKKSGEKITSLTAYDAGFARILDELEIDIQLVGDSLGMALHGERDTLSVTMDDMLYHTGLVSKTVKSSLIIADMPYMSYENPQQALENADRLINEAGADVVKIEGGDEVLLGITSHIVENNIPVCGHIGLQPQSIKKYGGYKIQGRDEENAQRLINEACGLVEAGVSLLVMECIPSLLAKKITELINVPTIGIGAGPDCNGQVLVIYDVLGITSKPPKMAKNFLQHADSIQSAVRDYVQAVKSGTFPGPENCFD